MTNMSLAELISQRDAIEKQIANAQRAEKSAAIAQIRSLMSQYGLSVADIGGKAAPAAGGAKAPRASSTAGTKVAPKYRNPATGDTWTGRGLKPKWLSSAIASGRQLSDFAL
jgi:DNA-binding protein H-NS